MPIWVARQWLIDCFKLPEKESERRKAEEAKELIVEALEKQELRQLTVRTHCPRCGKTPEGTYPLYCSRCGQRIML